LLCEFEAVTSDTEAKRNIVAAIEQVAKRLGNTKAVCRKSYIHPAVLDSYLDGSMLEMIAQRARKISHAVDRLTAPEAAVLNLLQRRLTRTGKQRKAS
jgi:DNA topoisomerase-1